MTPGPDRITAFLPCRKGSERVLRKNIRPFAGFAHGLIEIKLRQLLATRGIDAVVLSTNDEELIAYARTVDDARLRIHRREDSLATGTTSTDSLVGHALSLIPQGHILWTHVTSPFLNAQAMAAIVDRYRQALTEGYDSLMTVTPIHSFVWNASEPINYDRRIEKWPRTQTLEPVYEVNSGAFLASAECYATLQDRIGRRPFLYETDRLQGFDIDWEVDFQLGEAMHRAAIAPL